MSVNDGQGSISPTSADAEDATSSKQNRLMKKREWDRKSQRMARDRTKARMAYLEKLVEDFQKQDTSGQIALLSRQLAELERERDHLSKIVNNVRNLTREDSVGESHVAKIQGTSLARSLTIPEQNGLDSVVVPKPDLSLDDMNLTDSTSNTLTSYASNPYFPTANPFHESGLGSNFPSSMSVGSDGFDIHSFGIDGSTFSSYPAGFTHISNNNVSNATLNALDPIIPQAEEVCDCSMKMAAPARHQKPKNLWRFANELLTSTKDPMMQNVISREDDTNSETVVIRAVLDGWDTVADNLKKYVSWQILQKIDEELFQPCGKVERLAMLLVMNRLLQYHIFCTPDRLAKVPSWHIHRPSQSMLAHSYAIDFFTWPGLRERFVFSQHRYCSNQFWDLFRSSIRVLWPFEFRDCYTRNVETENYQVSPLFNERIRDIKCWTMGPEIFKKWPELYSDIATVDHIPASVSNSRVGWSIDKRWNAHKRTDERIMDDESCLGIKNYNRRHSAMPGYL